MKEFNSQKKYSKKIGSVRAAFNRAAESYDNYSVLQCIAADRLIESLDQIKTKPTRILDLGSGTGYAAKIFHKRYRNAKIFQVDIAEKMLEASKKKSPLFFFKGSFYLCRCKQITFY